MLASIVRYLTDSHAGNKSKNPNSIISGLFWLLPVLAVSQATEPPPEVFWERTYGGSQMDEATCVFPTTDTGYIVAGWTSSFGAGKADIWLLKTDFYCDTLWTKTYGGAEEDKAFSVTETSDSGYLIAGNTASFGAGNDDIWILKTDKNGNLIWEQTYGYEYADYGRRCCETSDSNYLIIGATADPMTNESDLWVLKVDRYGNSIWEKRYGDSQIAEEGQFICETRDGYYIAVGSASFSIGGDRDAWLLKLNPDGDTVWTKRFGEEGDDYASCVDLTEDNGYILTGLTFSYGKYGGSLYLVKTNEYGTIEWQESYDYGSKSEGFSTWETTDGDYVAGGYTFTKGEGNYDGLLFKIDAFTDTVWSVTYGGVNSEYFNYLEPTPDTGFIGVGWASVPVDRDVRLVKFKWGKSIIVKPNHIRHATAGSHLTFNLDVLNCTKDSDVVEISAAGDNSDWIHEITDTSGNPLGDTDADGSPDVGLLHPDGGTARMLLNVTVPQEASEGTVDSVWIYARSSNNDSLRDSAYIITNVISPFTLIIKPHQEGIITPQNPEISFPLKVINNTFQSRTGEITYINTRGWSTRITSEDGKKRLKDSNENGLPDVGHLLVGDSTSIQVELQSPVTSADLMHGALDSSTIPVIVAETTIVYVHDALNESIRDSAVLITLLVPDLTVHNYPNPFEDETRVVWNQPTDGEVTIRLADRAGRMVATICEGECEAGIHSHLWQAETATGQALAPGVYVIVIDCQTDNGQMNRALSKMVFTGGM